MESVRNRDGNLVIYTGPEPGCNSDVIPPPDHETFLFHYAVVRCSSPGKQFSIAMTRRLCIVATDADKAQQAFQRKAFHLQ